MAKLCSWKRAGAGLAFLIAAMSASSAQTLTTLASFDGSNGSYPLWMSLVQGTDGNFYGVTQYGGTGTSCSLGCGTVFKVTPEGVLTSLHSFDGSDGEYPQGGVIQATDGNFYGITTHGGANGEGTIFKITSTGTLTTVYNFCPNTGCSGPFDVFAGLVQGSDGNFYGTSQGGGDYFDGTIYKVTPAGQLTTLHSFDGADGLFPQSPLIQATNGSFYGTTFQGGTQDSCVDGCGTVFKITAAGDFSTVYDFCAESDCTDGWAPYSGVVQGSDGNFYGTTYEAATGTVFKLTPTGTLTTLYNFGSEGPPEAGLVQGTDGKFYGTSCCAGSNGDGYLFNITSGGTFTTLVNFDGTNGANVYSYLVQGTNGKFYSTTGAGGASNEGTVFSLAMGLKPFVETRPTSAKVGAKVTILGNNLRTATNVTFNGVAATFSVVSSTEITTSVPAGATSGRVEVKIPPNTLKSSVNFRVTP
jgi:uncharacterized repeat protein (TIGR03803 family)